MSKQEQTILGHPKGAFVLAGTEFWERFGYFGVMGLLLHFLTSSPSENGFGWEAGDAKSMIGFFFMAAWMFPVLGSWLADRYIGSRRSIAYGALLLMIGYFLIATPFVIPHLLEASTGQSIVAVIQSTQIPLGQLFIDTQTLQALTEESGSNSPAILVTYRLMSITFYAGLLFIVLGNMLFKPCVVASVGLFYDKNDKRREGGYTILYLCINLGGLISNFIIGTLGERLGWQYGFFCAGIGMLIGLILFYLYQRNNFSRLDLVKRSDTNGTGDDISIFSSFKHCYKPIAIIMGLIACYLATYGQLVGLVNEFVFQKIDRFAFGFEIPATWFLSLNPFFIIVFGALFASLWQRLEEQDRNPSVMTKYFIGMSLICISFLCLTGAAMQGYQAIDNKGSMLWVVLAYLFFTLGELLIFPIMMALITRLTPIQYNNLGAGLFFFAAGIGAGVSGQIGALTTHFTEITVFLWIGGGALIAGGIALTLAKRFNHYITIAIPG
jgi:POT family proton-dependent oligopeptide transporter